MENPCLSVGSLFSGIGGFDLGLERAGYEIKWQVEIDDYCKKVLQKHWPAVTRYSDITTIEWGTVEPVAMLCGGFPCQDLSLAGNRAGIDGEQSGLWREYMRAIRALRPRYIIVENVPGLLANNDMGRLLGDLAACGYDAEWEVLSACQFGAPHTRERLFIVAYPSGEGQQGPGQLAWPKGRTITGGKDFQNGWQGSSPEPAILGMADRPSTWSHQIRVIGNAVVPQIAEALGRMILEAERQHV